MLTLQRYEISRVKYVIILAEYDTFLLDYTKT